MPKKDTIQKPFQPRHKEKTAPTAKMASVSVPIPDPPPISEPVDTPNDDDVTTEVEDTNPPAEDTTYHQIKPSAGLAEFQDVDRDYMEYIYPTAMAASIDLQQIPANYIDYLKPTANMADKKLPILLKNTSYAETDELFAHGILHNHDAKSSSFHADWGANIIIINDMTLFTEFFPCEECLSPIDDIPISGIKGFGTVIFQIGTKLVPVKEVAFMPGNPQCTFTTSHL